MNTTPRKFYEADIPASGQPYKKLTPMGELYAKFNSNNTVSELFEWIYDNKARLLEAEREYASQQAPASTPPVSAMEDVLPTQEQIDAAIDKYAFRVPYNGSNSFYDEAALKHFKAGIEWFKSALTTPTK